MTNRYVVTGFLIVGLFLITANGTLGAQERKLQRDSWRGLAVALKKVGAPELTLAQQDQIQSLSREFREIGRANRTGPAVSGARQAYQDAILRSDSASAQAQADLMANEVAARMRESLESGANFKIEVLNVLSEDQKDLLLERNGTSGLFRLLGRQGPHRRQGRSPMPFQIQR